MADFDYGNARLRAMKSRLLPGPDLERLAESGSLPALIAELSGTAYHGSIQAALARVSGLDCVSTALRDDMETTIRKVRSFYLGQAAEMVAAVLRAYDIRNLKAILRGLSRRTLPGEILSTVVPAGELSAYTLSELSRAADPRAAIDVLATLAYPFAIPLLRLRAEQPGAGTPEMELRLEQWHFDEAFDYLKREQRKDGILFSALQLDADITNLLTALRFAYAPEEWDFLREWLGTGDITRIFVGPGRLLPELLADAAREESVVKAVEALADTPYRAPLNKGMEQYASNARLSVFERQLQRFRLDWASSLIGKDPLGIGVVLGYLALKVAEVSNLGWIAQGIFLERSANRIRSELLYVT